MTLFNGKYEKFKALLLEARDEILNVQTQNADARDTVTLDQTVQGRLSRMDAMQRKAMDDETARRRARRLHHIEAALKRIEDDDYGGCVNCGEEIAEKRLELDPTLTTCIKHAK